MQVEIKEIKVKDPVMPQDLAMKEFQAWLDYKKKRIDLVMAGESEDETEVESEDNKTEMSIIEAMMMGDLVINEDMSMTYKLLFPIKDDTGNVAVKEINMKARMTTSEINFATKGVTKNEPYKMFVGYVSALSGEVRGIINKIDSVDFGILRSISEYFL